MCTHWHDSFHVHYIWIRCHCMDGILLEDTREMSAARTRTVGLLCRRSVGALSFPPPLPYLIVGLFTVTSILIEREMISCHSRLFHNGVSYVSRLFCNDYLTLYPPYGGGLHDDRGICPVIRTSSSRSIYLRPFVMSPLYLRLVKKRHICSAGDAISSCFLLGGTRDAFIIM